ncbi:MAG: alpha-galactosidase, partial [Solobacterium sp.]|nr:alpha-galactosidase [Solobacterium sp.]
MIDNPVIHAYYSSGQSSEADESVLRVRMVTEQRSEEVLEYHAEVTNCSDSEVFLESVRLWESESLQEAGIGGKPFEIFRSGRHKNDLPGVFTAGCPDERLKDVTSAVLESGEGMTEGSGTAVISDHLTMIRGSSETILAIEFLTGRDQLVQTVLQLDETGDLKQLYAETLFRICLKPSMTVRTESIRIALIREAGKEAEQFAKRKALLYGQRNRRHPAVFCTWYYYGLTVSLEDVRTCLREIRNRKLPYEVFQVDEGWEVTLGEYEPNERFPVSMKELAAEIRDAGMLPGLWSSPFAAHETASVWKTHPEWILKQKDGSPCLFPMNDTVYYVFDKNPEEYPLRVTDYEGIRRIRTVSPINAEHAENIAVTGNGTIDGNGHLWRPVKQFKLPEREWNALLMKSDYVIDSAEGGIWVPSESILRGRERGEIFPDSYAAEEDALNAAAPYYDFYRPVMVSFRYCRKVLIEGVHLRNSVAWMVHPYFCDDVTIRHVSVNNPYYAQNGDGNDVDSCRRVHIHHCVLQTGDDAICLKAGKDREARKQKKPCEDVWIHDCRVGHSHGGFVIGSEMSRGVRNVLVEHFEFIGADVGIRFKSAIGRGGAVEQIWMRDIQMADIREEAVI